MGLPADNTTAEGVLTTGCGGEVAGLGGLLLTVSLPLDAGLIPRVRPLLMVIGVEAMFECWFTSALSRVPVEGLVKKFF